MAIVTAKIRVLALGMVLGAALIACENTSSPPPPAASTPAPAPTAPEATPPASPPPTPKAQAPAPEPTPPKPQPVTYPSQGAITELVNGDLMCYAKVKTAKGKTEELGATFEICEQQARYLNQPVKFSYSKEKVNDCQSSEPCGKTKEMMLITKVDFVGTPPTTMTNGTWTITVGNTDSWDGTNNTGNWSYYGCDNQDNCLALTGGKVTCGDGVCRSGWTNGDYRYILRSPMAERSNTGEEVLTVMKGDKEVMTARGFKVVSP